MLINTPLYSAILFTSTTNSVAYSLVYAIYLTHRTRDAPDAVNESKSYSSAVFLITFVCVAGLPIVLSLPLDPYLSEMIVGLLFFIATMGANGFYFGQKMFYLLQGKLLTYLITCLITHLSYYILNHLMYPVLIV
jgi:hypothetical protein